MEHFDAVIVGSGFGGSVMAHRLSESKQRVCVLERGKAYPPLSFPRSPHDFARNFWDPSDGKYGMFDIWSFKGTEAVVSSGLGGGSLIYANVLIRKDEKWFVKENLAQGGYEYWPVTRQDLEPHYDRVEQMLGAQQYPLGHSPYDKTHKTIAFRDAAKELGYDWFLPKLAVTFGNPGDLPKPGVLITGEPENYHRAQRFTCRLCGECDAGCNYGSKNTLDYNYLSAAWRNGATIRTLSEVRGLRPRPGKSGYEIDYAVHSPDGGKRISTKDIPLTTISADRLILSAGTLGSTYLLLKNRHHFPNLSPRLGERFSTNGDLLSFAAKCTKEGQTRLIDPSHGPVITSSIRMGDALDGGQNEGRGFYLQDAGYPEFFNWIIETADAPGFLKRSLCFLWRRLKQAITHSPQSEITAQVSSLLGTGSDTVGTVPLLGMGRDIPNGRMTLASGKGGKPYLELDWIRGKSGDYFDRLTAVSKKVAEKMGGTFVQNPDTQYLNRLVTVHSLGGCSMGMSAADGVVNSKGEVFNYPGLYVADGSVMPGPVGPNPSLTIAALADRFADGILG